MTALHLPVECAVSLFLIVDVVAFVLAAIRPLEDTLAFHFVVAPGAAVLATVRPVIDTCYNEFESKQSLAKKVRLRFIVAIS